MQDLRAAAYRMLLGNVKRGPAPRGGNLTEFVYTCPAQTVYKHQWLWDSCFHAFVMARFDGELAKAELRTLLASARPDGLVPHVIAWNACSRPGLLGKVTRWLYSHSHYANLTQPPVLSMALEEVYARTGDLAFLRETLPATKRHYDRLAAQRDPDGDGLLSIISPLESGMDHSPVFDVALAMSRVSALDYHCESLKLTLSHVLAGWQSGRIFADDRFSVEDVAFNCIYALGLRSLATLCHEAGDPEGSLYLSRALETERAIVARCYDPGTKLFYSLRSRRDVPIPVATIGSLMPLALPSLPADIALALVENHLLREESFWLPYPLPSVAADHPTFSPSSATLPQQPGLLDWLRKAFARHHLVWRGSTWINTNWFLCRGLRRHGFDEVADAIVARTVDMIGKSGFWEFYHPYTGAGQGAENFGWSTLVVDLIDAAGPARIERAAAHLRRAAAPQPA